MVASVPCSTTLASCSKKNYDVTEAQIANTFAFLDFHVAALCDLCFTICNSYIEQVWPPMLYTTKPGVHNLQLYGRMWPLIKIYAAVHMIM